VAKINCFSKYQKEKNVIYKLCKRNQKYVRDNQQQRCRESGRKSAAWSRDHVDRFRRTKKDFAINICTGDFTSLHKRLNKLLSGTVFLCASIRTIKSPI